MEKIRAVFFCIAADSLFVFRYSEYYYTHGRFFSHSQKSMTSKLKSVEGTYIVCFPQRIYIAPFITPPSNRSTNTTKPSGGEIIYIYIYTVFHAVGPCKLRPVWLGPA